MKTSTWIKVVVSLGALVAVGVGVYVVLNRLDERMLAYLVGGLFVLVVFVVVGGLLIGKDLMQAYLIRRTVAQDDLNDLKQMAFVLRMLGGLRGSNVNLRLPKEQSAPQFLLPGVWGGVQGQQPDVYDGQYRDTTIDLE
ncbi:MAG: hypothetical protein JW934_05675 [Anaerolineae bacterium]|nr:hypothetical protein [Anaerolineae bacterium]